MNASEYKQIVLGLIFPNCISDPFEEQRGLLVAEETQGADPDAMFAYADSQAYDDLSAWGGLIIGGQIE